MLHGCVIRYCDLAAAWEPNDLFDEHLSRVLSELEEAQEAMLESFVASGAFVRDLSLCVGRTGVVWDEPPDERVGFRLRAWREVWVR